MSLFSRHSKRREEDGSQYGLFLVEKGGIERPSKYTVDIIAVYGLAGGLSRPGRTATKFLGFELSIR